MAHVILYGGSFNPPTLAHVGIAKLILSGSDDHVEPVVYAVPTFEHAYGKNLAPYEDRLELCRLAFRGVAAVSELDRVISSEPRGSMYSLCSQLLAAFPAQRISIVVGQDQAEELGTKWHRGLELLDLVQVYVIPRADKPVDYETYPWLRQCTIGYNIPAALRQVSSTAARAALAAGADTTGLLHPDVAAYCLEKGLYNTKAAGSEA